MLTAAAVLIAFGAGIQAHRAYLLMRAEQEVDRQLDEREGKR